MRLIEFNARARDHEGEAVSLQSWCKACQRQEARVRQGIAKRGVPYGAAKPSRLGLRSGPKGYIIETERDRKIFNAYQSELYRNLSDEQRANRRESDRIRAEKNRRAKGMKPRNFKNRPAPVEAREARLPVEPFAQWLETQESIRALALASIATLGLTGKEAQLAHDSQTKRLQCIKNRMEGDKITPIRTVSLDLADRVLMSQNVYLWELYDDDE